MTREQPEREIKGCQLGFIAEVPVHEQSANQHDLQRVPTKFGQFLQDQHDLQHNFDLCHAQALTLVQSIVPKHATSV